MAVDKARYEEVYMRGKTGNKASEARTRYLKVFKITDGTGETRNLR